MDIKENIGDTEMSLISKRWEMPYFIKTPWLVQRLFSSYVWKMPESEKNIYLTFDDGPHPVVTPFVLNVLEQYNAKATFFCIGKNVAQYPDIYRKTIKEGHSTGNHTQNHLNGWKTRTEKYLEDVAEAATIIKSNLFRPPYGRLKTSQAKGIETAINQGKIKIIFWDVLSADFDAAVSPEQCLAHVINNARAGSIVVFHDSEKAFDKLKYALPQVLEILSEKGFSFRNI